MIVGNSTANGPGCQTRTSLGLSSGKPQKSGGLEIVFSSAQIIAFSDKMQRRQEDLLEGTNCSFQYDANLSSTTAFLKANIDYHAEAEVPLT